MVILLTNFIRLNLFLKLTKFINQTCFELQLFSIEFILILLSLINTLAYIVMEKNVIQLGQINNLNFNLTEDLINKLKNIYQIKDHIHLCPYIFCNLKMSNEGQSQKGIYTEIKFYTTILSTVVAGYSIFSAINEQGKISRLRERISKTESKPVYTPTSLNNQFRNGHADRNFSKTISTDGKITGYKGDVFLMGTVNLPQGFKGFSSRNKGYFNKGPEFVLKMDYKQDIFSNDAGDASRGKYKINLNRILQSSRIEFIPRFLVSDYQNSVEISNYDRIDYSKALDVTYIKQQKRSLHVHQFIFTLGLLGLKFVTQLFFKNVDPSSFRGISVGIRDSEVGIKVGSGIAVIGQLIYDFESNKMKMEMPELIVGDRLSYLNSLKAQLDQLIYNRNIFLIIGAVAGIYSLRRLFKYLQKLDKLPKRFNSWRV